MKIMCVGDSITHGSGRESTYFTSYRYPFWKLLIDAGVPFEFVGPFENNFEGNCEYEEYKGQSFVNRHYATFGIKLSEVVENAASICKDVDFDMVIINLGTNDRKSDSAEERQWSYEQIPSMLEELTDIFRRINPSCVVFLTGLNDNWPVGINDYIKKKAEKISNEKSPVFYIPAPAGWVAPPGPESCTLDWAHPNEKGCDMQAQTYFTNLMEQYVIPNNKVAG